MLGEVIDTLAEKIIPQGAAELAQAFNAGNPSYVPYGPGQQPAEVGEEPPGFTVKGTAVPETKSTYQATDVSEIGPPLATPMVKQSGVKNQQIDPLDKARANAHEAARGQGKSRQMDIGD